MAGYGIAGWGVEPVFPDAVVGAAGYDVLVLPTTVMNDGGWELRIANVTSFPATQYRVHLGPAGNATDPVCYPGVAGQGEIAQVEDGRFITVWSPILPIGGPYSFFFETVPITGAGTASVSPAVTIVAHLYRSRLMSMRRLFPPRYKTNYRLAKRDRFPQV